MTGGRPRRPATEARLVREAVQGADPAAPREPIARTLATDVVRELQLFIQEADDPLFVALGDIKRSAFSSPVVKLATDPEIDTLSLFLRERVAHLEARSGRSQSVAMDNIEQQAIFRKIEKRLARRYLGFIR